MLYPIEQLKDQLNKTEQQLLYHLVIQQMETNRLLNQLLGSKPVQEAETVNIDDLKRPDLMKRMKEKNPPKGWIAWSNEKMVAHLKGAS